MNPDARLALNVVLWVNIVVSLALVIIFTISFVGQLLIILPGLTAFALLVRADYRDLRDRGSA